MTEYLLQHNLTWIEGIILFNLWLISVFIIFKVAKVFREYKDDKRLKTILAIICITYVITTGPVLICGLWHFINMLLYFTIGHNLYFLLN